MIKIITVMLSSLLATSVFAESVVSQEAYVSQSKDEIIFQERLSKYINDQKAVTEASALNSKEVEQGVKSANDLWRFASEFPNSKFANDSKRVLIFINFLGALASNDKNSMSKWLKNMEGLANFYPDTKMQDLTIRKLKDLWGEAPTECFMSNADLLIRMQADIGFNSKDYESAIKYYSSLKDKLDTIKEPTGLLETEVYTYLAISYEKLGKFKDELVIANEAINRFPNNEKLKQTMENVIRRISSNSSKKEEK